MVRLSYCGSPYFVRELYAPFTTFIVLVLYIIKTLDWHEYYYVILRAIIESGTKSFHLIARLF